MPTTSNRKQCPHCGLWLDIVIDWRLAQNYELRVRGIVPKKEPRPRDPGKEPSH